jgi:hypothetical protein
MKERKNNIKIVGDGTFKNTQVLDADTGEMIHRITQLEITSSEHHDKMFASIEFTPMQIEMEAFVHDIKIGDKMYHPFPCPVCNFNPKKQVYTFKDID